MLNRKHRIGERSLIKHLLSQGLTYKNKAFIFKYQEGAADVPRFATVVSSKIHKTAVGRNRLRRQIQEALRLNLSLIKKPLDTVVIAKEAAKTMDYQTLTGFIVDFIQTLPHEK